MIQNISFLGGFKLELWGANGKLKKTLTDGWVSDDTTAQTHSVSLPQDMECQGCTVSISYL